MPRKHNPLLSEPLQIQIQDWEELYGGNGRKRTKNSPWFMMPTNLIFNFPIMERRSEHLGTFWYILGTSSVQNSPKVGINVVNASNMLRFSPKMFLTCLKNLNDYGYIQIDANSLHTYIHTYKTDIQSSTGTKQVQNRYKTGTKTSNNEQRVLSGKPDIVPLNQVNKSDEVKPTEAESCELFAKKNNKPNPKVVEVVDYLNQLSGSTYKSTTNATVKHIKARLAEGFTVKDLKLVVEHKVCEWSKDDKMRDYLRPITLFNSEKFEGYLVAAKAWNEYENWRAKALGLDVEEPVYDNLKV